MKVSICHFCLLPVWCAVQQINAHSHSGLLISSPCFSRNWLPIPGSNKPYYHCLEQLKLLVGKKEEQTPQVVFHTDQGSVYSSRAFCQAHEHYNILRSMSREGTPTDNPIIEALNGWMKEELYLDFRLASTEDVPLLLDKYVHYFNNRRPAAALGYKSPVQYKTELGF